MAVAYWNLVLSGRFKFLDLWNTFLLVSVPLLLAVRAQCEEGGLQVMWLSILPNQSITCGHCGKREVLYRDRQEPTSRHIILPPAEHAAAEF